MNFKKLSIIIPAFNESPTIQIILDKIKDTVLLNNINKEIVFNLSKFIKANCFQKEVLFYLAKIANELEILDYKLIFNHIDSNNNGVIEIEEIFNFLRKQGDISDVNLYIKLILYKININRKS